jgi:23S rRNA pseudouridine2605 synthase
VTVKGRPLHLQKERVYYLFHKPKFILTSMSDPEGRPTVADFFKKIKTRIFPVGRLDWDSEGMLLMTNDGEFANIVTQPKEEIHKVYIAKLDGQPTQAQLQKLRDGVSIVGGRVNAKKLQLIKRGNSKKNQWVRIAITEGKNRQVRKMFQKIGFDVLKLRRVAIGGLPMGGLKAGEYQKLTATEVLRIFKVSEDAKEIRPTRGRRKKTTASKPPRKRS